MNCKKLFSGILTIILSVTMTITVHGAYDSRAALEEGNRQAVEAAIRAGTVPAGTTTSDCLFTFDQNGTIIVVRYRDKSGNWISIKPPTDSPPASDGSANHTALADTSQALTEEEQKAYADRVFELVNMEREKAGVPPLERRDYLNEAAMTRAEECASVNDIRVNGQPHTRPDGSEWFTVLGISKNYNYGENAGQGRSADKRMESWMDSSGHRANILRADYTEIGIGVAVSEQGKVFAIQIFYRHL